MKLKKKRIYSVLVRWFALILSLAIITVSLFVSFKPFIFTYAKSEAETILLNAVNAAVLKILTENNVTYSDISLISRNEQGSITGIEINAEKINMLKSLISNEISRIIASKNKYTLSVALGTLLGSEFTTDYGPHIKFKMQLTETAILGFESQFEDSGINNVLHQILINADIRASILMIGCTEGFSVSTSIIAAQTVIAGEVPESFTNVIEYPGDDLADEIFNYSENY